MFNRDTTKEISVSEGQRLVARLSDGKGRGTVAEHDPAIEYQSKALDGARADLAAIEGHHDNVLVAGDPEEIAKHTQALNAAKTNVKIHAARLRKLNEGCTIAIERERTEYLNAREELARKLSDEGVAGLNEYVALCEKRIVPILTRQAEIDAELRSINQELAVAGRPTILNPGERVNERRDISYIRPERAAHLPNPVDMAHPFWSHGRRQ